MTLPPSKLFSAVLLLIAILVASFLFLQPSPHEKPAALPSNDVAHQSSGRARSSTLSDTTSNQSVANNKVLNHTENRAAEDTTSTLDTNLVNQHDWWFEAPTLVSQQLFNKSYTAIDMDVSCDQHSGLQQSRSLEENLAEYAQVDLQQRYQEDLFYFSLTQFWRLGDYAYQFVAIWERDMPALYRYEFYRSRDHSFNQNVEALDIPMAIPAVKDVLATNALVEQLLMHYQQQGASLGARILESSLNDPSGDHQLTLVNSQVQRWASARFTCSARHRSTRAFCHCEMENNHE